jgi:hypothetical protein
MVRREKMKSDSRMNLTIFYTGQRRIHLEHKNCMYLLWQFRFVLPLETNVSSSYHLVSSIPQRSLAFPAFPHSSPASPPRFLHPNPAPKALHCCPTTSTLSTPAHGAHTPLLDLPEPFLAIFSHRAHSLCRFVLCFARPEAH